MFEFIFYVRRQLRKTMDVTKCRGKRNQCTAWSSNRQCSGWMWRKLSSPEGGGTGSPGHGTKLPEFRKHLDNTHMVWFLGGPVWNLELDLMVFMSPFQLGIFYDPMALSTKHLAWVEGLTKWPQRSLPTSVSLWSCGSVWCDHCKSITVCCR